MTSTLLSSTNADPVRGTARVTDVRLLGDGLPSTAVGTAVGAGVGTAVGAGVGTGVGTGGATGGREADARSPGVGDPIRRATELLSGVLATLEPARLTGPDAARLYGMFAAAERLSMAGKTLLAPRIDESGVWRDGGHRSSAVMLAELEGVPTGQARNTLEVGRRLPELPGTEAALRGGELSGPKVTELSGAAVLDPTSEGLLLAGAGDQPLQTVKERCQRARATAARHDPVATVQRIHADRRFVSWTDSEGAFCFQGRDTVDRGAKILEQMQHTVGRLRAIGRTSPPERGGPSASATLESDRALHADAFYLLMTARSLDPGTTSAEHPIPPLQRSRGIGGSRSPSAPEDLGARAGEGGQCPPDGLFAAGFDGGAERRKRSGTDVFDSKAAPDDELADRPATCSLMVRIDLEALLRGEVGPGEVCEIDNQGPIPVAMARDLANDSFLRLVFHRSGDIRAVSHLGRTINRRLRTALAHRDRTCVVPGCGVPFGLEIDHVVPFAEGGPTELENLALLCHHHHYLKTYEGWTLERIGMGPEGSPTWAFTPLPPFGEEPDPPSPRTAVDSSG